MRELDKVIGYEPIKKELYRIIDVMNNPEKYKELGVNTPNGILLDGVPGIGKSLIAKCFMAESGRPQFIIRKDIPDGGFVDFIRETFEKAAEQAPSIILLDDLDKFSNEDEYHCDTEEYVAVQAGIDKVKGKEVFVIATTNDYNFLPDSLVRDGRFDKRFHMKFPKGEDAKKIVAHYLKNKKVANDIDIEEIIRFCRDYSCADLETVINEAGLYAGYEGHELITQDDIKRACLRKFYSTPEEESQLSEDLLRRRAIHEAGHLLLAEHFNPGSVNFASISAMCSKYGGVVSIFHEDGTAEDLKNIESDIMVSLAGKAATEIILGETDMGSNKDLHDAFDKVRSLLDNNCAYDFSSWCHGVGTSDTVYRHLDDACGIEMARYFKEVKKIITENRELLEALANALLEKKTLSYKAIAPIIEQYSAQEKRLEQIV